MIININKDGKQIANCEITFEDNNIILLHNKKNIENVFHDMKQTDKGFTDILDIDIGVEL